MKPEAKTLRDLVERLHNELKTAEGRLKTMERTCLHEYGPVTYDPIRYSGGFVRGDPPGTMGIDRIPDHYVPSETIDRWRRECLICGKIEYTKVVKEQVHVEKTPYWSKY